MSSVLLAYSTVDGHTLAICERIRSILEREAHDVTLIPVETALNLNAGAFDRILIGASIRYGKHRPAVYELVARSRQTLLERPNAFFSVSAVARKAGKDTPAGNAYFQKFTRLSRWKPQLAATFAGKIDYSKYGLADRLVIQFIMWLTNGPTSPDAVVDFTDWAKVEQFATEFAKLQAGPKGQTATSGS